VWHFSLPVSHGYFIVLRKKGHTAAGEERETDRYSQQVFLLIIILHSREWLSMNSYIEYWKHHIFVPFDDTKIISTRTNTRCNLVFFYGMSHLLLFQLILYLTRLK
jgi:hypothetical protein